jgi:flagellar protein FliL
VGRARGAILFAPILSWLGTAGRPERLDQPGVLQMATAAKRKTKEKEPEPEEEEEKPEADGEGEGEGGQSGGKLFGFLTKKLMIIAGAGFLALAGAGTAAYIFVFSHSKEAKPTTVPGKPVVFVDLPEVLVNLSNTGSERTQYLKVKIVLELADQTMIAQIQPVMPRVMDAFQTYLRELRPSDLDGSAGLYRLKEELTRRVNAAIAPSRINAVLFKEIVVQ